MTKINSPGSVSRSVNQHQLSLMWIITLQALVFAVTLLPQVPNTYTHNQMIPNHLYF